MRTSYALPSAYPPTQCACASAAAAAAAAAAAEIVITDPGLSAQMSKCSAGLGPILLWPAVARCYRDLASLLAAEPAGALA
jgi:hypothetical protein